MGSNDKKGYIVPGRSCINKGKEKGDDVSDSRKRIQKESWSEESPELLEETKG